jgi:hypothetical protein
MTAGQRFSKLLIVHSAVGSLGLPGRLDFQHQKGESPGGASESEWRA